MLPRRFVIASTLVAVFLSTGSQITAQRYPTSRPYSTSWWTRYRTGYWSRTAPYWLFTTRSPAASYACQAYSKQVLHVDNSLSIASPNYPNPTVLGYYTSSYRSSNPTCSWQVVSKDKNYLELTFDHMSISSRYGDGCSCGRVVVQDGGRRLGTFCKGKTFKVSSKQNSLFVEYYACNRFDKFKATIRAKNVVNTGVATVVPLVVGFVLFGIIFAVLKCTKKIPSTGQPGTSSAVYQVPLQSFPPGETLSFAPQQSPPPPPQYPQEAVNAERFNNDGIIML